MTDSERELREMKELESRVDTTKLTAQANDPSRYGLLRGSEPLQPNVLGEVNKNGNQYPIFSTTNPPLSAEIKPNWTIRYADTEPKVILKIGAAAPALCLEVISFEGERIVTMDYEGVITSHVEDPVKAINGMLTSDLCQRWESGQMRAYLMLLRAHFLVPQPDDWKKKPLL